jgi:hypothetical protein
MTSIFITPGISGKKPVIEQPGVETFQRSFPQDPGKFCTLFNTRKDQYHLPAQAVKAANRLLIKHL